jgi:lipopolysaccharide export system permease protein
MQNKTHMNRPSRVSRFDKATYKINVSGFTLNRSDNDIFKDKYEMLNVFQIKKAMDSLEEKRKKMSKAYLRVNKRDQAVFRVSKIEDMKDTIQSNALECFEISDINKEDKNKIYKQLVTKLRSKNQNLENQIKFLGTIEKDENNYWIEFHRKFALSVTLVILFFMGASLGSIIKKGGFGAPVVIAAVIFILYFSIITTGENLADSQVISPFFGMWMPCIVFTPIALILTRAAARDSKVFAKENWNAFFKIKRPHERIIH